MRIGIVVVLGVILDSGLYLFGQTLMVMDEIIMSAASVVYEIKKSDISNADVLKKSLDGGSYSAKSSDSGGDEKRWSDYSLEACRGLPIAITDITTLFA